MSTGQASARHSPRTASAFLFACVLTACSGGGGDQANTGPGPGVPPNEAEAARFLTQATFGPDDASLASLQNLGYSDWIAAQMALPPSLHRPEIEARQQAGMDTQPRHRQAMWWKRALTAPDQLRQRMAFALSEIFVISDQNDALGADVVGCAEYYDLLVRHAFDNYRELIESVSLSPQMGKYLSHLRNQKPDPVANTRPDENYAREVMQLFSIGLFELNADGTRRLDGAGQPIPTYSQSDIIGLAHVFTGWNYADAAGWFDYTPNYRPMEPWDDYHDMQPKLVLGTTLPAGRTARQDLAQALDLLANHANVGPFLSRQLIQRLVTSNPSPAYVARVAAVWANDGTGTRGNLGAVLRAILVDGEARTGEVGAPDYGKVREPILMQTALWRAFGAVSPDGSFMFANPEFTFAQAALRARSVFNFFRPDYAPQGEIAAAGRVSPEFQILDHTSVIATVNQMYRSIFERVLGDPASPQDEILLDLAPLTTLAADVDALIDRLDALLLMGSMSATLRSILHSHLEVENDNKLRAQDALYLVVTSPEFLVQK
ncbi:MAG TPA: DUF1800 domain-containing protein [Planctomycetota bacterium]|nr:DUF1800 domain-containing protein [Planctomycetota bacterium]